MISFKDLHEILETDQSINITEKNVIDSLWQTCEQSHVFDYIHTKFDIALAMSKISRYGLHPSKMHWEALKWIFIYLKKTKNYNVVFDDLLVNVNFLLGYVEVDYVQDMQK